MVGNSTCVQANLIATPNVCGCAPIPSRSKPARPWPGGPTSQKRLPSRSRRARPRGGLGAQPAPPSRHGPAQARPLHIPAAGSRELRIARRDGGEKWRPIEGDSPRVNSSTLFQVSRRPISVQLLMPVPYFERLPLRGHNKTGARAARGSKPNGMRPTVSRCSGE